MNFSEFVRVAGRRQSQENSKKCLVQQDSSSLRGNVWKSGVISSCTGSALEMTCWPNGGKVDVGSECQTCLRQTFTAVLRRISLRKAKNCKTWTQKLLWRSLMTVFTVEVDAFATRCISWPQSLCSSMEAMESGHSDTLWDTFRYFHPLTFLSYLFVSFLSFFKYFFLLKFYVFLSLWFCFWMHVAVSVSRPSERKQMMKKHPKNICCELCELKKNIPKTSTSTSTYPGGARWWFSVSAWPGLFRRAFWRGGGAAAAPAAARPRRTTWRFEEEKKNVGRPTFLFEKNAPSSW